MCSQNFEFTSLDDVYDLLGNDDFEDRLFGYLDNMPRNRESALEILTTTASWDDWNLYRVLLQEFSEYLKKTEIHDLLKRYRTLFAIPLDFFIDEEDLLE